MLCLRCGMREQFADNLCLECLLKTIKAVTLPDVIQGSICRNCNRLQKGKTWLEVEESPEKAAIHLAMISLVISDDVRNPRVELSVDHEDKNVFRLSGKATSVYKGAIIEQELETEVRLHPRTCPWCSRRTGNYYEAIIQLRGVEGLDEKQIDSIIRRIREDTLSASVKDPNVFISNEEKVRGGYDFYMGNNSFARQLSQRLHDLYGGETKWTSSLFGRKQGRDIYRYTYLVRLPGFMVGDYLVSDKDVFRVNKISKRVHLRDLIRNRDVTIDTSDAMLMRPLKADDVEVEAVVIMETEGEVQVLHPATLRPVDLIKTEHADIGEKARCAYIDGELYLL